jgi:hypothetical protein
MIAPPRFSERLLATSLALSDRDAVVGDLAEEFTTYVVRQRGAFMARWWYRWQVARSLAPLFFRSWERATLSTASSALGVAAVTATLPPTLLVMTRTFVLQQVPLKTTAEMSMAFASALLGVTALAMAAGVVAAIGMLKRLSQ